MRGCNPVVRLCWQNLLRFTRPHSRTNQSWNRGTRHPQHIPSTPTPCLWARSYSTRREPGEAADKLIRQLADAVPEDYDLESLYDDDVWGAVEILRRRQQRMMQHRGVNTMSHASTTAVGAIPPQVTAGQVVVSLWRSGVPLRNSPRLVARMQLDEEPGMPETTGEAKHHAKQPSAFPSHPLPGSAEGGDSGGGGRTRFRFSGAAQRQKSRRWGKKAKAKRTGVAGDAADVKDGGEGDAVAADVKDNEEGDGVVGVDEVDEVSVDRTNDKKSLDAIADLSNTMGSFERFDGGFDELIQELEDEGVEMSQDVYDADALHVVLPSDASSQETLPGLPSVSSTIISDAPPPHTEIVGEGDEDGEAEGYWVREKVSLEELSDEQKRAIIEQLIAQKKATVLNMVYDWLGIGRDQEESGPDEGEGMGATQNDPAAARSDKDDGIPSDDETAGGEVADGTDRIEGQGPELDQSEREAAADFDEFMEFLEDEMGPKKFQERHFNLRASPSAAVDQHLPEQVSRMEGLSSFAEVVEPDDSSSEELSSGTDDDIYYTEGFSRMRADEREEHDSAKRFVEYASPHHTSSTTGHSGVQDMSSLDTGDIGIHKSTDRGHRQDHPDGEEKPDREEKAEKAGCEEGPVASPSVGPISLNPDGSAFDLTDPHQHDPDFVPLVHKDLQARDTDTTQVGGVHTAMSELVSWDPRDYIETFQRGGGKGGQKINKTANMVLLKHVQTGTVVKCQATRDLQINRKIARKRMAEKLQMLYMGKTLAGEKRRAKIRRKKARQRRRRKAKAASKDEKLQGT